MFFVRILTVRPTLRFKNVKPRFLSSQANMSEKTIDLYRQQYERDSWTNITPKIIGHLDRNLHLQHNHPLSIIRKRIVKYFYGAYLNPRGNPLFSVYENLSPVVSTEQNFDNLLIPKDHPSRAKSDCYYINKGYLLRAHTTAHQVLCNMILISCSIHFH